MINITLDRVKSKFLKHLRQEGVRENTIKFYLSDLNHFSDWLIKTVSSWGSIAQNLTESLPYLSEEIADLYKKQLISEFKSIKTVNRKLTTVRRFSSFLIRAGLLSHDFAKNLTNVSENKIQQTNLVSAKTEDLLASYKEHLKANNASDYTIRNYLADIKQFLAWMEEQNDPATT